MFLEEPDGQPLGAGNDISFLRREIRAYRKFADIRQVLLKFILKSGTPSILPESQIVPLTTIATPGGSE
jgi:hypothetical protein